MTLLLLACAHPTPVTAPAPVERPATPDEVLLLDTIDGAPHLVTDTAVEATGPWTFDASDGATRWISPTASVDPDRPIGSRWQIGPRTCAIVGYTAVVEEYVDQDPGVDGYTAPSCGSPKLWPRLDCEGAIEADFAVPVGVLPVVSGASSPEPLDPGRAARAERVARATSAWVEARAAVEADATARELPVTDQATVDTWSLGSRRVLVVEGAAWSGEGQFYCGGEDVYRATIVIVSDEPEPRVLATFGREEHLELSGLVDVEGDGIPELRLGAHGEELLGRDLQRSLRSIASCVCGC